ncbi:hypothetical protein [Chachezhania sediminis]|uniref:hypothetical protein n=1 Tax=Chachezhania sediminis TaxID=2599291 RepID=UPI00131D257E|nr:hypothetical protein [Chachezhania sediminis]
MSLDEAVDAIKEGLPDLVENVAKSFADDARADLLAFLADAQDDLKRYAQELADKKLKRDEFEFLVKMKAEQAQMLAVSAKGIARARLKHLMDGFKSLVIKSLLAAI